MKKFFLVFTILVLVFGGQIDFANAVETESKDRYICSSCNIEKTYCKEHNSEAEAKANSKCSKLTSDCKVTKGTCSKVATTPSATAPATYDKTAEGIITYVKLENPLSSGTTDVRKIIGVALKAIIGIMGAVALFVFFKGGETWLVSMGSPEKIKKGMQTMFWGFIGIFIVLVSYYLLNFIIKVLEGNV